MAKIKIKFPDGSKKSFDKGIKAIDVVKNIGEGLARAALAVKIDDELYDLDTGIGRDCSLVVLTFKDQEGKEVFWHSAAHVFAHALKNLYKDVKIAIGPPIENGFHYDFEVKKPFSPEDLEKLEAEMRNIVDEGIPIVRKEISQKDALKLFKDNPYKVEMIKELKDVAIYEQGDFVDLCKGPHVPNTSYIKAFKLTKIAGAYWKGDAKNKQLQRVYGVAFPDKKELKKYLNLVEEAGKRDHRKIGKELDLYSFYEEAPGMPFWHAKGTVLYNELIDFARQLNKENGYNEIMTPIILNSELWHKSGHWDNFKENMYFTKIDEQDYAVKPMNCPGGLLIYKNSMHSYKELPLRNAEFGYVHRHELSGVLSGLFRVRSFTQDDAHVFCTENQLQDEIIAMVDYAVKLYSTFGFDEYTIYIATKPEKAMGSNKVWEIATKALEGALNKKKLDFKIKEGEGAFYGPKIEFNIKDAIGRNWQCGTIQVDFSMPDRFEATYEGKDGKKHVPVMVHRAMLGSLERFIGILVEHYAGKFPLWLSPNQVKILTVADRFNDYAEKVAKEMKEKGLRVEIDDRSESINKKVRDAQLQQFNYILVVGEREQKDKTVTVRIRDNKVIGAEKVDTFVKKCLEEIEKKK